MSASPSNLYTAVPLDVVNYDFSQSPGLIPPVGWQVGGLNLPDALTLSYDTGTPYTGSQSLIVESSVQYGGASSVATYPVVPGQVYGIAGALKSNSGDPMTIKFGFFDSSGNLVSNGPLLYTTATTWQYMTAQATVPFGATQAQIQLECAGASGGIGEFDVIQVTLLSTAIPYYLSKITSEYQNSPRFLAFLTTLLQPIVDTGICAASMNQAFSLQTAVGSQLDVIGVILGASRTLPFAPVGVNALTTEAVSATGSQTVTVNNTTYMQIGVPQQIGGASPETVTPTAIVQGVSFTAVFTNTHLSGVSVTTVAPSAVLDDAHYRTLLQAKVLQNQFNGQYMGTNSILWQAWQIFFPGGRLYITDNQNMTATIFLVGAFDPLYQQMIINGLIVPRCQGVEFVFEFAELPIYGWGNLNPTFVAGWGTGSGPYPGGNWA